MRTIQELLMKSHGKLKDGSECRVVGGTHAGKSGIVRDIKKAKQVM